MLASQFGFLWKIRRMSWFFWFINMFTFIWWLFGSISCSWRKLKPHIVDYPIFYLNIILKFPQLCARVKTWYMVSDHPSHNGSPYNGYLIWVNSSNSLTWTKAILGYIYIIQLINHHTEVAVRSWYFAQIELVYKSLWKWIQWEFQDPKMEVLYHIRPYFVGILPYIGLI